MSALRLEYLILLALQEPTYGYEISKQIKELGGDVNDGSLYRNLDNLVSRGMIEVVEPPAGADQRRTYYAITTDGQLYYKKETALLQKVLDKARDD